jgi:DNA-binding SARP family transcriptional activator
LVKVRLLGNVEIVGHDRTIRLERTAERCLLAALALNPNRALTFDSLLGIVWTADSPGSPETSASTRNTFVAAS